jgi:glycosyltransferase involved in cell wall biosynthesis
MQLCIDASNINTGGGLTHLVELLSAAQPERSGIDKVAVWAARETIARLAPRPWLTLQSDPALNGSVLSRIAWQRRELPRVAHGSVLFVPGGTHTSGFHPLVTMIQNWLPFDPLAIRFYPRVGVRRLRLELLRKSQSDTLRRADGVIYLTEFAKRILEHKFQGQAPRGAVVPHGVSRQFFLEPRTQLPGDAYSTELPFRFVYVSPLDRQKHHAELIQAMAAMRRKGLPVAMDFVGATHADVFRVISPEIQRLDPTGAFLRFMGAIPYDQIHNIYNNSEASVFASSCETFGMPVLEAMASGLPVACSNQSSMPEIGGDAAVYFDPENVEEIVAVLTSLFHDQELRTRLAAASVARASQFTWARAAEGTFSFLASVGSAQSGKSARG